MSLQIFLSLFFFFEWGTEALWMATKDLVEPEMDMESRQLVLNFLLSLIEGQVCNTNVELCKSSDKLHFF